MDAVAIENILTKQPKRWLPAKYASYDELLAAAVEDVVNERSAPKDLSKWRYGGLFPLTLSHPIFGRVPLLRRWAGPGIVPQSGGSYTVKQVGPAFGPSERMTVDFADLDRSTLNVVTGESGQIFSRHFMDQWSAWYEGRTFPLAYSRQAVEKAARHRLTFEPAK
jgi:penicillin amidase